MQGLLYPFDHDPYTVFVVEFDQGAFETFKGPARDADPVADFHFRRIRNQFFPRFNKCFDGFDLYGGYGHGFPLESDVFYSPWGLNSRQVFIIVHIYKEVGFEQRFLDPFLTVAPELKGFYKGEVMFNSFLLQLFGQFFLPAWFGVYGIPFAFHNCNFINFPEYSKSPLSENGV